MGVHLSWDDLPCQVPCCSGYFGYFYEKKFIEYALTFLEFIVSTEENEKLKEVKNSLREIRRLEWVS